MFKSIRSLFLLIALVGSLFIYQVQTVYAIAIPAEINKQFTPILINAGDISVLRVTIFNPNTFPLTNASWTDNLVGVQPGLRIANPSGINTTCVGGTVTAVPGTTTLSLSGGNVPAQVGATPGACYVEINVTSTTVGNLINNIPAGALTASGNDGGTTVPITNTTPANATITVVAVTPPTLTKGFNPNTIFVGGLSQLTITINNNDLDTNLTNTAYTDTLPANVVLATPVSPVVNNCGPSFSLIAVPNTNTISLSNATVTPNFNCTVTVNVTSNFGGQYTNTIPAGPGGPGSITTQQGVTNASPASANLNVQPVGIIKAFSPANIAAGGTSTLTITLQNPTGSNYTGVGITDTLPTGLTISGTPASPQCGGTITSTATSVTLSGGTIPASLTPPTPVGTCTITLTVASAANSATTTLTNTIPANSLVTAQLITNPVPASAPLNIQSGISVLKAFSPTSITAGGTSTVTITLRNHTGANFTGVNFTDSLPANLTVSGTPVSSQCGGTITSTATSVALTGGTIPFSATPPSPPGTCTITFQVTSLVAGTYSNTIPAGDITTDQGIGNTATTTTPTSLTVNNPGGPVLVSKAFQTSPILPGVPSRLRITVTAPTDIAITGINVSDTLPAGLVIVTTASTPPAPANPTSTCTGANVVAPIGGNTITVSGASILAGASCTITVYVTSNTPGSYPNTIPAGNITTIEGRTNTSPSNTATLVVTSFSMSKAFYPPSVQANGLSTLTITLQNTTTSPLINVQLTDALPGSLTDGVVVAPVPNASTTCTGGTITAAAGSQTITMTGGTVPAQVGAVSGICTITIDVQGRDSNATPSNRTNIIPTTAVSGTVQNSGVTINPIAQAQAILTTEPLTIGVVKGFDPVLVYGGAYSTMSVQLVNPNNAVLTGIAFTDDMTLLGTGMELANPVVFDVGTCGGVLTGNPGDTSFAFSGGTLAAHSNCTLTLRVVMAVNGNLTNRIPAGAVTTFNGVSSTQPAEASLTNLPGASVTKSFNPSPILVGDFSTLTLTIKNTSDIPLVGMALTDELPGLLPTGLEVAGGAAPAPTNTCGGSFSAPVGSQLISLTNGSLAGNATCVITISVTSRTPGTYINTIPIGGLTATAGGSPVSNNNPASAPLVVNPNTTGYSLGNRVWFDTNNSGTIDGTEVGINGVKVDLYAADVIGNPTGALLSTQTTANGGYYRFDNLPAGNYVVVIPASEFGTGGVLDGYWSSGTTLSGAGTTETTAPDSNTDIDSDDNGTLQTGAGTFNGAVISSAVMLGPGASEPTGETDKSGVPGDAPDAQSNLTVDFGFYRQQLGNQIFVDVNNNGTFDAGDLLLAGAKVQLFASDGTTEINVGPDGILGTADDAAGGVTTGAGGTYLFSGLPQGNYIVKVTPPPGYTSTVDTANPTDTTTPDTNIDQNDNGIGVGGGQVSSNIVTLTPGSLGAATNNTVNNATGTTLNPTLDFGFNTPLFSLGNRVWFDTDNSGTINGTEVGISGVRVELYQDNGNGTYDAGDTFQSFATTDVNGYYRFDNLPAGDYVVIIPADNFRDVGTGDTVPGNPLSGYWSSGTGIASGGTVSDSVGPDADIVPTDSDDNGVTSFTGNTVNYVSAQAVTLGPGASEPTGETDKSGVPGDAPDAQSNLTVDFGFYRQQLGNLIFVDANKSGMYDAGDTLLPGATVQLFASNGTTEINVGPDGILGTADDAPGGVITGASGTYLFNGLPAGDYIVKVTPPVGYSSTVDTASSADINNPNTNIDNNDNGVGTSSGQAVSNLVSLTPGSVGAATNNTVSNFTGTTTNLTMDFGFVPSNGISKIIISTDQAFTAGNDVAIGEMITYQVTVNLPVGVALNNVTITDRMDKGLAFVDCLSANVSGVDLTSTVCATAAVSAVTDAGDSHANPANPGRQVVFNIGNIAASAEASSIVIQYRAIVLDTIENQQSHTLNNDVAWTWTGGSQSAIAPDVTVVEPDLKIEKKADVNFIANGSPAVFTLVISHTSASNADAFDVVVKDVLPVGLDYVANSINCDSGEQDPDVGSCIYDAGTRTIKAQWSSFTRLPVGGRGIIRFSVIGNASIPTNGSVTNVASVEWTSILGNHASPISSFNPLSTERYYDPTNPVNLYSANASIVLTPLGGAGGGVGGKGNKSSSTTFVGGFLIPVTGFAPNIVTKLDTASSLANSPTNLTIEIPVLKVNASIVGVQFQNGDWDLSWLQNQAGWLNGTAYPTWTGNSVLTGHVVNADGKPGVFSKLKYLASGEYIFVYNRGYRYTYQVVSNQFVQPNDITVLNHEDKAYLTLITCDTYDVKTGTYLRRVAVRAALVDVTETK